MAPGLRHEWSRRLEAVVRDSWSWSLIHPDEFHCNHQVQASAGFCSSVVSWLRPRAGWGPLGAMAACFRDGRASLRWGPTTRWRRPGSVAAISRV